MGTDNIVHVLTISANSESLDEELHTTPLAAQIIRNEVITVISNIYFMLLTIHLPMNIRHNMTPRLFPKLGTVKLKTDQTRPDLA